MAQRKVTIGTESAPIPAGWFVTGRGKTARYYAALDADETALKTGAVVALTAKTGAVTFGRLNGPATDLDSKATDRIPAGIAVWEFVKANDLMTPAMRAENAALKAEAVAAFKRSEAGIAQAERIAARAVKREAEAAAGMPDTRTVKVTVDPAIMAPAAPAANAGPTLAEQAEALKAVGFSAAEILAALSSVNPPATPAASKPATPRKPAAGKPISLASLNAAAGKRSAK